MNGTVTASTYTASTYQIAQWWVDAWQRAYHWRAEHWGAMPEAKHRRMMRALERGDIAWKRMRALEIGNFEPEDGYLIFQVDEYGIAYAYHESTKQFHKSEPERRRLGRSKEVTLRDLADECEMKPRTHFVWRIGTP